VRQFEKLFGAHFVAISYCTDSLSQQSGIYRETGNFQFLGLFHFRPVSNLNAVEYNGHSQSPSTLNVDFSLTISISSLSLFFELR
jgi:hypothetical protein